MTISWPFLDQYLYSHEQNFQGYIPLDKDFQGYMHLVMNKFFDDFEIFYDLENLGHDFLVKVIKRGIWP